MMRRRPRQQVFLWKTHGGPREGAGRKRAPGNQGLLAHVARPEFVATVPVHVTMRVLRGVPKMRAEAVMTVIAEEISRASAHGFRLLHFSVQNDHVHLIAEGNDGKSFSRGMQRIASRIARRVNMLVGRRGKFWKERYHRRDLPTPRQFRNALVYVVQNFRKHGQAAGPRTLDGCSSARWLDAWADEKLNERLKEERARVGPPPTARATSFIARVGWKRHGLIDPRESPRAPG